MYLDSNRKQREESTRLINKELFHINRSSNYIHTYTYVHKKSEVIKRKVKVLYAILI